MVYVNWLKHQLVKTVLLAYYRKKVLYPLHLW